MPAATSSGADTSNGGAAKSRDHKQGNQDRKSTDEQRAAVTRVRRCAPTAFYDILGLEQVKTTVTDTEIKKAYRKLSLLTHPDKNGHEHADEAFKMVSRAFGVLSDADKKQKYDRYGGDPDSRFGGGQPSQQQSPFSGFGRNPASAGGGGGGGGRMWDEEISPEEMFNRFFGGGGGGGFGPFGGGGMFDTGPQFVFNLGGGPGVRVHQFGGARPRRRPREPGQAETPQTLGSSLMGLLPLLVLFILPLLSSLFSGSDSAASGPSVRFSGPEAPFTLHRMTNRFKVDYYVNPTEVEGFSATKLKNLDDRAENIRVHELRILCERAENHQQRLYNDAQGWFVQDPAKMKLAQEVDVSSCKKLDSWRVTRNRNY